MRFLIYLSDIPLFDKTAVAYFLGMEMTQNSNLSKIFTHEISKSRQNGTYEFSNILYARNPLALRRGGGKVTPPLEDNPKFLRKVHGI